MATKFDPYDTSYDNYWYVDDGKDVELDDYTLIKMNEANVSDEVNEALEKFKQNELNAKSSNLDKCLEYQRVRYELNKILQPEFDKIIYREIQFRYNAFQHKQRTLKKKKK